MTIEQLRNSNLILLECISGSRAYGLAVPQSDTDIKGVFILPEDYLLGSRYIAQIANETNDEVYYELGRFIELLKKNNPNMLEMLGTPADKIRYKHPLLDVLTPSLFLTQKSKDTFAGFAYSQIKKARGLNKKIVNPVDRKKKTILSFCHVLHQQGSIPLEKWLEIHAVDQTQCGLVNIPQARGMYGLYLDLQGTLGYKGIQRKNSATDVLLSSIPKGEQPSAYLYFNTDGYTKYCKDYKDYWNWVKNRNEVRYSQNIAHGKNYDSKNMMHTFRLLEMAMEILTSGKIIVDRPDREFLLSIRRGEWDYDELISLATSKMQEIELAASRSILPEAVNEAKIEAILVNLRKQFYRKGIGRQTAD